MRFRVAVDDRECALDLRKDSDRLQYVLSGGIEAEGSASVTQISQGVFSVLLENTNRSLTVTLAKKQSEWEAYVASKTYLLSASDTRDRASGQRHPGRGGSIEIRAHIPGKVVRVLVQPGAQVQAGQGVIVVEAMKMQNEMKAPHDGFVKRLHVSEGATVSAGEPLIVIDSAAS